MKILIITGIFPPDIGGPATYVPVIAEALTERGHRVRVITLSDVSEEDDGQRPYPVVRIKRSLWRPVRMALTIAAICRYGITADVLFVNGLALEAALANLLLRKPLVQKVVGDLAWERAHSCGKIKDNLEIFQQKKYSIDVNVVKFLQSWWSKRCSIIITPSVYLKKIVVGWGVAENVIELIYNSVSFKKENVDITHIKKKDNDKKIVLSIGRLIPLKNFDDLIIVTSIIKNIRLLIIGEGPYRSTLERLINYYNINERVHLIGALPLSRVLGYLAQSDVFVINSLHETFPHVVLEAFAAGVPVIATKVGGIPEIVFNHINGLLIPPNDRNALMFAIKSIIKNARLREKLIDGGKKTLEKFSNSQMIEKTEKVLLKAINQKR